MGITGLLPFVKNSCRPANIKDFSGSTVAIDAYGWLHKGAFSCSEKLVKEEKTDGYVYYCMKRLNLLTEAGLRPIMVFDGCNLPSKEVTEKKRKGSREKYRQRGKELLCEGKIKEARECFQKCVDVTPEMAREVVEACRKKSIDCIVAPYEADAQLAYLEKIGMAQLIITEDSDMILFGCNRVFFKMDNCGGGLIFEKENLSKSFGNKASKFSFEKFRYMCILSGCDYLPSLHGIGLAKANKFFTLTTNADLNVVLYKLPSYLKMTGLEVPKTYVESFIKANNTFLHQLVFCPQKKCLVPLNPYPEGVHPDDMEYAGKYLPDQLARQLAMGDINVNTMKEFDVSWSDPPEINEEKSFVWGSQSGSSVRKAAPKVEAFKFSTPKQKVPIAHKRQFSEMVKIEGDAGCTDEELFSMYSTPKRNHVDCLEEEPIVDEPNFKKESKEISTPKTHPKILNIPFKKIVRSRFFSTDSTPNKDLNSSRISTGSPDNASANNSAILSSDFESPLSVESPVLKKDSSIDENQCEFNIDFDTAATKDSPASIGDSANKEDKCEFTINFGESSPKKDNKENIIHRFAKKKVSATENRASSPPNTSLTDNPSIPPKNDSWLDILDDECNASTNTVSSAGKASKLLDVEFTKPVFLNNPLNKPAKKLPATRLHDFKFNKDSKLTVTRLQDFKFNKDSKPKLNLSQGSDGNSCNSSFDGSQDVTDSSSNQATASPYFSSSNAGGSSYESVVDLVSDPEDVDDCVSKMDVSVVNKQPKAVLGGPKALKPLNNKNNKSSKCRTIGLSKNRKNCDKVSRKETLMNFNFIRQPKKEIPVVL